MTKWKYYKWVVVALLWVVALLNYLDRQMLATMQDAIKIDIAELRSATNFGHLMGIFLWIYGFMSPVSGMIADKFNRKWIITGSLFVWSAATYGMGLANTYDEIYWLRALMGVSEALYIPAALSLITDYHTGKTRSLAVGIHMTGLYFGQALGGFGGTVAHAYTWHTVFHSFGLFGVAYSLILIFFLREHKYHKVEDAEAPVQKVPLFKGLALLFNNISFWVILFYFAVPSLPGWAIKNWLPTLFSENLDIPMRLAGPYSTISIAASSFIGVIIGGLISDHWVQKNVRGRVYTGAIGLFLMIPALFFLGFGHSLFYVLGAAVCFGIGFGMFDANNMPIVCQFVPPRLRATAYGLMNMIGVFFGAFITDYLGSSTDEGNLGHDFAMLAIVVAVILVVQILFLRPKVQDFQ